MWIRSSSSSRERYQCLLNHQQRYAVEIMGGHQPGGLRTLWGRSIGERTRRRNRNHLLSQLTGQEDQKAEGREAGEIGIVGMMTRREIEVVGMKSLTATVVVIMVGNTRGAQKVKGPQMGGRHVQPPHSNKGKLPRSCRKPAGNLQEKEAEGKTCEVWKQYNCVDCVVQTLSLIHI